MIDFHTERDRERDREEKATEFRVIVVLDINQCVKKKNVVQTLNGLHSFFH